MSTKIFCPCCKRSSTRLDVWYDCKCFQGLHGEIGNKCCENCKRSPDERDKQIAAVMREKGWDKDPSPGMLDYLTPGWRDPIAAGSS